jgi:hypothetical protein
MKTAPSHAPALDQPHENDDNRENEQNMNEASHGVRGDEAQQPKKDENNSDGFEHKWDRVKGLRGPGPENLCVAKPAKRQSSQHGGELHARGVVGAFRRRIGFPWLHDKLLCWNCAAVKVPY